MNTDQIAAEAWERICDLTTAGNGKTDDFVSIIKSAIEKATVELQEERDYYESRRGGECQKCGSWVCPPLTCLSCLAGLDLHDELRKENQRLTEKLQHPETAAAAPATSEQCPECGTTGGRHKGLCGGGKHSTKILSGT